MANNNNTWNVNNDDEIPKNLYVSAPSSPMPNAGYVSSSRNRSNAKGVNKFKRNFNKSWANEHPSDPVHVNAYVPETKTNTTYANMIAKWKARNTTKNKKYKSRANYNVPIVAAKAETSSGNEDPTWSPFNMYRKIAAAPSQNRRSMHGANFQWQLERAYSRARTAAEKEGKPFEEADRIGKEAKNQFEQQNYATYTEVNTAGKVHYPGVEAKESNRRRAANRAAANAAEKREAERKASGPVKRWATVSTNHRGVHSRTRRNRRN